MERVMKAKYKGICCKTADNCGGIGCIITTYVAALSSAFTTDSVFSQCHF